ncbi:hypothetical protein MTO96_001939 [Rhipicephalus appendiculatus]
MGLQLRTLLTLSTFLASGNCLDNGLALLPPMGWRTWQRFGCNTDPVLHYDECISETLISDMADRMLMDGYRQAGYDYLIMDDCWSAKSRDAQGNLVADSRRFPRGMKTVVDYVHSRGLKFGLNAGISAKTCNGYPGSFNNFERDAKTFADWGVDFVNVDGCNMDPRKMDERWPMLYSCEWPMYQAQSGITPDYEKIAKTCNIWRNYAAMTYNWSQIYDAVQYEAKHHDLLANVTGPGAWTDYGAVVVGNYGLSESLQRSQVAYWAVAPSPVILSVDLRSVDNAARSLLLSPYVIAVNQDPLRAKAGRFPQKNNLDVWTRWVMPRLPSGDSSMVLMDVLNNNALIGLFYPGQKLSVAVPPLDVILFKATITDR